MKTKTEPINLPGAIITPDHDLHVHTCLSACCSDKARHTPRNILRRAEELGLNSIGFADHIWVNAELAPSAWYRNQGAGQIEKLRQDLGTTGYSGRVLVGCEAETIAPGRFGITPDFADSIDFVLLACSHFHMAGFVEQPSARTPRAVADQLIRFFRSAVQCGLADIIAHPLLPYGYLDLYDAAIATISDEELLDVLGMAKEHGVALEITAAFLPPSKGGFPRKLEWHMDTPIRILTLARQAGCRFTFGSDAHELDDMNRLPRLQLFVNAVGLTPQDLWIGRGGSEPRQTGKDELKESGIRIADSKTA
ncbi:MAG: PHP domain-containing protein [Kiritimatiellota bacterium]|nr:PHP domain-containing protein [Kiritimatiellota bacterium]